MSLPRVVVATMALVAMAGCSNDGDSGRPATKSSTGSSAASTNVTMSAEYTCGPLDGGYISVTVTSGRTTTLMAELVVGETALGRSGSVRVPGGQETAFGFDPQLTDQAYDSGAGQVRLRDVNRRGEPLGTVALETVDLRLPPGVQCG